MMTWIMAGVEGVAILWLLALTTGWWRLRRVLREIDALLTLAAPEQPRTRL